MALTVPKIDAHHHFWRYTPEEYGWIDDSMTSLRRDFGPGDLQREIQQADIQGVISVQARQTTEETGWLLDIASRHPFIYGVVGWAPLADAKVGSVLESFADRAKLRGVRHVLQGELDDQYMLRDDFNRGIRLLKEFGLAYDILVFERHLQYVVEFVRRHPQQTFVLDHIAKPRIREAVLHPWRENICKLAEYPNVCCKVSGMVTEANYDSCTEEELAPYFDTVLEAFGPQRLLFGSDWPVCLVATSYSDWVELVSKRIAVLTEAEQAAIMGGTAARIYNIGALT